MEVFQINFGGGEPFLRRDFLDILRYAQGKGITTCVSTNGTLLTDALVEELLAMEGLYLQVSLDGAYPETNDAIRGAGTFARIVAGIERLTDHRFPDFSLNMVVTRVNFAEIAAFRELALRYGAKTRLSRFRPSGGGCSMWEDYRLTKAQLTRLSRVPGRPHRDPDRGFLLRPGPREPAGARPADVRGGQDDHGDRARRQCLPVRVPLRPRVLGRRCGAGVDRLDLPRLSGVRAPAGTGSGVLPHV